MHTVMHHSCQRQSQMVERYSIVILLFKHLEMKVTEIRGTVRIKKLLF